MLGLGLILTFRSCVLGSVFRVSFSSYVLLFFSPFCILRSYLACNSDSLGKPRLSVRAAFIFIPSSFYLPSRVFTCSVFLPVFNNLICEFCFLNLSFMMWAFSRATLQ